MVSNKKETIMAVRKDPEHFVLWEQAITEISQKKKIGIIEKFALIGLREKMGTGVIYLRHRLDKGDSQEDRDFFRRNYDKVNVFYERTHALCVEHNVPTDSFSVFEQVLVAILKKKEIGLIEKYAMIGLRERASACINHTKYCLDKFKLEDEDRDVTRKNLELVTSYYDRAHALCLEHDVPRV